MSSFSLQVALSTQRPSSPAVAADAPAAAASKPNQLTLYKDSANFRVVSFALVSVWQHTSPLTIVQRRENINYDLSHVWEWAVLADDMLLDSDGLPSLRIDGDGRRLNTSQRLKLLFTLRPQSHSNALRANSELANMKSLALATLLDEFNCMGQRSVLLVFVLWLLSAFMLRLQRPVRLERRQ
jgi:hypothetical protein